jgi:alpha-L-fucosidase
MLAAAAGLPLRAWGAPAPLTPYGAAPSPRQLAWHRMEANAFVHITLNTFTDKEWGYGDESPALFNPTDFDADQIVGVAKAGGLKGVIVTAKHHDGFCLWPSAYTDHSVKNSPFRDGKGDVLAEVSAACRRQGLKFGVYLSPWDRHHADYGRPAYIQYYRNQLRELLTRYGPIFEVWFDGANGGDGYYGGAREVRKIAADYYDWPTTFALVRQLQPMAVTFDPKGSDLRWVGNETGEAGDPCWATMDEAPYTQAKGMSGVRGGSVWWPAEVDVSLRPGWFWHAAEEGRARDPANLTTLYFQAVGRGANLLLNLPPNARGVIPKDDARKVTAWGDALRAMFADNLAAGAKASASNVRGGSAAYAARHVLDGRADRFWACDDEALAPSLVLTLPTARTFDVVRLREHLPLGLRVDAFALDAEGEGGRWIEFAQRRGIGAQRLVRLPAPLTTRRVRLRILEAPAGPAITEFSLFRVPTAIA